MKYLIQYINKQGKHVTVMTNRADVLEIKIKKIFARRIEAVAKSGDVIVARVWKDSSQSSGWNYSIDIPQFKFADSSGLLPKGLVMGELKSIKQ